MKKHIIPFSEFRKKKYSTFEIKSKKNIFKGVVFEKEGKFFAYHNLCQHLPVALNFNSDQILTQNEKLIQCQMHGALYEIESGVCTEGPCKGQKLTPLPFEERENAIVISIPEELLGK